MPRSRHQLTVLQRKLGGRVQFTNSDRLFFILLYRWFPSILNAITIIRPETVVRWHRAGLRRYWRWKSRPLGGRPLSHRRRSWVAFITNIAEFSFWYRQRDAIAIWPNQKFLALVQSLAGKL